MRTVRTVLEAMRLGVDAYLTKPDGLRGRERRIRRVALGERVVTRPSSAPRCTSSGGSPGRRGRAPRSTPLTPREREILGLLAEGLTMRQMAGGSDISPRTVETHVAKLYRKLGVRTRVQAIARAASLGLIDLADKVAHSCAGRRRPIGLRDQAVAGRPRGRLPVTNVSRRQPPR